MSERRTRAGRGIGDRDRGARTGVRVADRRRRRGCVQVAAAATVLALVLVSCGSDSGDLESAGTSEASGATSRSEVGVIDTAAAVEAAGWGDNVQISVDGDTFTYRSNGVPNHEVADQYLMPDDGSPCAFLASPDCMHIESKDEAIAEYEIDFTFTTKPELVDEVFQPTAGPLGLIISGSSVYNPFEADGTTVAMASNFTMPNEDGDPVAFMDDCMAHPSPHPAAQYHYHGLPQCVVDQVDEPDGPSHMIGVAFDGFPIYGDRDIDGAPVDPADLDECNGIDSPTPEFPDGIYHYVLTHLETEQSSIRCLHGRMDFTPKVRADSLTGVPAEQD